MSDFCPSIFSENPDSNDICWLTAPPAGAIYKLTGFGVGDYHLQSLVTPLQVDLTILVLDVNDNAPVFQRRDYAVTVPEDVAVGTEVLRVLATSVDIGPNAEITYRIRSGNELAKFTIDRNLGEQMSS